MSAYDLAHAGAAVLGVSSIVALVVFYITYGLHRPTGARVRLAAFLLLAVTGVVYSVQWWVESTMTRNTSIWYFAFLRFALAATLINFSLALYTESHHHDPAPGPFN